MNKIRLGIIGLGGIAGRIIPTFLKHPKTDLRGGFDIDAARMRRIKNSYGIIMANNAEELINHENIDAIYLAVPPKLHHDFAIKIMRAGKHILCEKPLAGTIKEAKEMHEVAIETQIVHAMNFPLHYGFAYDRIKELLEAKSFGALKRIDLSVLYPVWPRVWQQNAWIASREEGGFVREVFTHFIHLIQTTFGPINNIHSFVEYPEDESKCETGLIALGELENGVKVVFNGITDVNQETDLRLTIYGTEGSIELKDWNKLTVKMGQESFVSSGDFKNSSKTSNSTFKMIDAFYQAIEGKESNVVTFEDGLLATKVVERLLGNV